MKTIPALLLISAAAILSGCASSSTPRITSMERVTEVDTKTGEVIASYQVVDGVPIDPDSPGSAMIQSGADTLMRPTAWYEGWFNFFSPTDEEYAHSMVHNGTVVNLYAQHLKAWKETTIDLPGPDGTTYSIPFGSAPRASDYLAYLYDPQSPSQRFGLNAQSGLSYLGMGGGLWLAGKGIDAANAANGAAMDGANAGAAATTAGFNAGSGATLTGVTTGAGIVGGN